MVMVRSVRANGTGAPAGQARQLPHRPPSPLARDGHSAASAPDLLALQRSAGNRAATRYLAASTSSAPPDAVIQRKVERGRGTGWGVVSWVKGGEAIWNRIDKGFNTDLFALKKQLEAFTTPQTTGISRALVRVNALLKVWDTKPVYFEASPANGQAISAAQFAVQIENVLTSARSAVGSEEKAEEERQTKEAEEKTAEEERQTAKEKRLARESESQRQAKKAKDQPKKQQPAEPKAKAQPTVEPQSTTKQQPKTKTIKPPSKASAKEIAQQENERREAANRAKKAELEAKRSTVHRFGVVLSKETSALANSEKLTWSEREIELSKVLNVALNRVGQAPAPSTVLSRAYEEWTEVIERKRTANELERRGTLEQWQIWTGLNQYQVKPTNAVFTEAVPPPPPAPPTEGPVTADGVPPAQAEAEPEVQGREIPIHVTYDRNSVAAPRQAINTMGPAAVLDHLLGGPATWQRIHATLEANDGDNPHVYWGGGDLGLGAARYHQWTVMPEGYQPGPEGSFAKPKVEQVLNDYVAHEIVPKVTVAMASQTYKVYDWKTFAALSASVLTAGPQEVAGGVK